MALNEKNNRRSSHKRRLVNRKYKKPNLTENNQISTQTNSQFNTTTQFNTNAQCALKNQLDGRKMDPKIFGEILKTICFEFDFRVLIEFPSQLVDGSLPVKSGNLEQNGIAIAILCPNKNGYSLLFAVCKSSRQAIRIIDEKHISKSIVKLACSYVTVLSLFPKSTELSTEDTLV